MMKTRHDMDGIEVQVRFDNGQLEFFDTVQEGIDFAREHNHEVWKVSFYSATGERVRLVRHYARNGHCFWVYEPIDLNEDAANTLHEDNPDH